jgi:cell division protein FtsW
MDIGKIPKRFGGDPIIWIVVTLLCFISIFAVYGIGGTSKLTKGSAETAETISMLISHAKFILLGLGLMYLLSRINFRWVGRLSFLALIAAIVLLLCTYIWGTEHNEAKRSWNIFGVDVQTVQLAELIFVLYFARWIAKLKDEINQLTKVYYKILIYIVTTCGMIMVAKSSGAVIIGLTYLILLFISQLKLRNFILTLGLAVLGLALFIKVVSTDAGRQAVTKLPVRIETPLNRFTQWKNDEKGNVSSDVIHLEAAIATAGILPKLGGSIHKTGVDQSYSDYIYAFTVEEYGICMGIFIILLYIVLFYRITKLARSVESVYGRYLSIGMGSFLIIQAFTHISTCIGMGPIVGETLPLVSRGGMSILIFSVCMGILLNISVEVQQQKNG